MTTATTRRALVIGGGPGGLTAALALRRIGIEAVVYERSARMWQTGSGLTLWPNAFAALDTLALADPVRDASQPLDGLAMDTWRGTRLFRLPASVLEARFGGSGRTLRRSTLVDVLLQHLDAEALRPGASCVGIRRYDSEVIAFFEDGSEARGDLLIGADGIHSVVRARVFSKKNLCYNGFTVWRGIAPFELASKAGVTLLGQGAQFGLFGLMDNYVYWFASSNAPEGIRHGHGGHKAELLARFAGWRAPIPDLLAATDEAAILRNDIYDLDPLNRWSDGRVTLLGDAAHPLAPTLGQGACQAIEDAIVLAHCLAGRTAIPEALHAYQARRIRRAGALTMASRRAGRIGQWEHPVACWLRNQFIKRLPVPAQLKQLEATFRFAC